MLVISIADSSPSFPDIDSPLDMSLLAHFINRMRNEKEKTRKLKHVYQLKYGQARCHKECVNSMNVNYTDTDVTNDKGHLKQLYFSIYTG